MFTRDKGEIYFFKNNLKGSWFFFFCVSGETIKNNKTRVVERGSVLHFTPLHIKSSFFLTKLILVCWLCGCLAQCVNYNNNNNTSGRLVQPRKGEEEAGQKDRHF